MKKGQQKGTQRVNWPVTILLILGSLTIFFPLYMAIVIAFKSPSEMTNDIAGILSLPSAFRLDNFTEAMRVTDFWHSLGNSLLITCTVILIAIAVHSLAGYAIGRNMAHSRFYNIAYLYIVSGMFVPFAILYAHEPASVFRLPEKHPARAGRSGKSGWSQHLGDLLENHFSHYEAHARHGSSPHRAGNLE